MPLGLDAYVTDWLSFLLRWLHVVAGIAWIGASFYFIALDLKLLPPEEEGDAAEGVAGEAWEIHGGGFYHVQKYRVAPPRLPGRLLWFKWEAYTTWLSGFALLVVLYFANADTYLVDRSVADVSTAAAIGISVGVLAGGWAVYEALCRGFADRRLPVGLGVLALTAGASYGVSQALAPRAAYIVVGGMLGTVMAANVLLVIIPAHWELLRAKKRGREPDPAAGLAAKERSVHNNYLTLPVVITMVSNHFPAAYGHEHAWAVLVALAAIGAWIRHFFNLRHAGRNAWWVPLTAAAAIAAVAVWIAPRGDAGETAGPPAAARVEAGREVFAKAGCGACHTLADVGSSGTVGPSLDEARPPRSLVLERVTNGRGAMPSFRGTLSADEIEAVADYVAAVAGP